MMRLLGAICVALLSSAALAQDFNALARVDAASSHIRDADEGLEVVLTLSQAVPYRVFTLAEPARLVVDFNEVDWRGIAANELISGRYAQGVHVGPFVPGWSRMVVDLASPQIVDLAGLKVGSESEAVFTATLKQTDQETFEAASGAPEGAAFAGPKPAELATPIRRQQGDRDLIVMLDPGHGGIDPGAERGDIREADIMLTFAVELKEMMLREGGFDVRLTREDDSFVPLETRVTLARAARADLFISLHADALSLGSATGSRVYTLSEKASDVASQKLAERHDRADLLAGIDLSEQDDEIANILMDLARTETQPRADKFADTLVASLREELGTMYKKPRARAGFSVLKAADIPSVLLELGFLSNPDDLEKLQNPVWRRQAQIGILAALKEWAVKDAAEARLLRQ
ncbi:N-acetylmuramoyl-L-alanine amidase [Falsihalocynthiibacter sp. SS001]|uniref:N-acetylmuramoyl-L-alanine amidase n=1 Tax=Falsihalocynthiibacter sp. SS001 TaxID=3349698 RepID=UPI0036D210A8